MKFESQNDLAEELSNLESAIAQTGAITHLQYDTVPNYYVRYTDGQFIEYNGWTRTDYIPILGYRDLYIDNTAATRYCAFYDSDHQFIIDANVPVGTPAKIEIPVGAAFFVYSNDTDKMPLYIAVISDPINSVFAYLKDTLIGGLNSDISLITGMSKISSGSYSHDASSSQYRPVLRIPVQLTEGTYIIILSDVVWPTAYNSRFFKANTLNGSDIVKYADGVSADALYFVSITAEQASQIINYTLYGGSDVTAATNVSVSIFKYQAGSVVEQQVNDAIKNYVDLPSYYYDNDWLDSKISEINTASAFTNGVVLPFITDLHFQANAKNSKYLLREVIEKTAASIVLFGGDYAPAYGTQSVLQGTLDDQMDYFGYLGHDICFSVLGNHDYRITASSTDSTQTKFTWGKTYNTVFRPNERWQINARTSGGFYCIDNDVQKTRIIMLNSCTPPTSSYDAQMDGYCRVGAEQTQWFVDVLKEKANYKIIVVSHIPSDPDMPSYSNEMDDIQTLLEAFVAKTSGSTQHGAYDFTNTTNELVCHICGHSHSDDSHVSNGVLSISTTCDAHYRDDGHGAVVGTVTEQAFDVYCINYDTKAISAVRVGRGNSRSWTY